MIGFGMLMASPVLLALFQPVQVPQELLVIGEPPTAPAARIEMAIRVPCGDRFRRCSTSSALCGISRRAAGTAIAAAVREVAASKRKPIIFEDRTDTTLMFVSHDGEQTPGPKYFHRVRADLRNVAGTGRNCHAEVAAYRVTIPAGSTSSANWIFSSDEYTNLVVENIWSRMRAARSAPSRATNRQPGGR